MVSLSWSVHVLSLAGLIYAAAVPSNVAGNDDNLVARAADTRSEAHITDSVYVGAPNGQDFTETFGVMTDHRRLGQIGMTGCEPGEHVDGIYFSYRDNSKPGKNYALSTRRGRRGNFINVKWLTLAKDEYVVSAHLTTWKKKVRKFGHTEHKTRVGYVKFVTNKQAMIECGSKSNSDPAYDWGDGSKALLYISGSQGEALDALQGHFIPAADF